ncbi:Bone morphogenetic protein receptor type-1B [Pseudolycoriella hygida]|uniref:receptor protein serine/threonine kinase n=1 Tax=Pseudolycoriella hygida TaxID=35572 RepID=A0A9Q0S7C5_9DIPT|nr:Bone morphogenetic protein receptor type-1B [Pseudolycoriella hygida]
MPRTLFCYCDGHCPDNLSNGTCETKPGGSCFSAVEEVLNEINGEYESERTYGCMPPEEHGGLMQCKISPSIHGKNIECCDSENFCNKLVHPQYIPRTTTEAPPPPVNNSNVYLLALVGSMLVCVVACVVIIAALYLIQKRREGKRRQACLIESVRSSHTSPLTCLVERTSGSGSGLPLLVQRTIAKQIELCRSIGRGRYGEVYLAKWRDENVAVKVFFTDEEGSWFRETEIYQTVLMRHENILGFIAADINGTGARTLITDYHELGSLYDFLQRHVLNADRLYDLAFSLAAGLEHLHLENLGRPASKPGVAHRDLKSKNILVKQNGQCAISDFGMAVKFMCDTGKIDVPTNGRVGTYRYMAPEVLNQTINTDQFEAYKTADMYSLGLVLWEMSRRCTSLKRGTRNTTCEDYALPFYDVAPSDPNMEQMRTIVCESGMRPIVPVRWQDEEILQMISKIMQECWHANPSVRLTALRVKKSLSKYRQIPHDIDHSDLAFNV